MNNTKSLLSALLLSALAIAPSCTFAQANSLVYSPRMNNEAFSYWGAGKKDTYDVATLFESKQLKGKTINFISIPIKEGTSTKDVKLWLTKKLSINDDKQNVADIISLDAEIDTVNHTATAVLPTPYTIDCDSIYLGSTFTIPVLNTVDRTPIVTINKGAKEGMWIHTQKTYLKWMNKSQYGCAVIEVGIGGAESDAASITIPDITHVTANQSVDVTATIFNQGYNGVKSIDYSYTVGENKGNGHVDLATPIPAYMNASAEVVLPIQEKYVKGNYPVSITLDKVNDVAYTGEAQTGSLKVYNFMPTHNPVMEEYTGTWCGWCPRGWVALEVMNRLHPNFIGLSYHFGDVMQTLAYDSGKRIDDFPASQDKMGYPGAVMDRNGNTIDPYYGSTESNFGIEKDWLNSAKVLAPAAMETEATFTNGGDKIEAQAHLIFPEDLTGGDKYKMEFVVVADSLRGEGSAWAQHSYFTAANSTEITFPEAEILHSGNQTYYLTFNDVVVATSRIEQGLIALPANIEADKQVDVKAEFIVNNIRTVNNTPIIQNSKNLRIVALLLNADGTIANGAKAKVTGSETTGIQLVNSKNTTNSEPTAIYDLQGRKLTSLQKGLNIVTYPSGLTRKVMVK